jgi:hypothetical protein
VVMATEAVRIKQPFIIVRKREREKERET